MTSNENIHSNDLTAEDVAVVDAYRRVHFGQGASETERTIDRYGLPEGVSDDPVDYGATEIEPLDLHRVRSSR